MEKTIAERITAFCQALDFDAIPSPVLEKTKDLVVDTKAKSVAFVKQIKVDSNFESRYEDRARHRRQSTRYAVS